MKFTRRFFIHVHLQFKNELKENYLALTSLKIPLKYDLIHPILKVVCNKTVIECFYVITQTFSVTALLWKIVLWKSILHNCFTVSHSYSDAINMKVLINRTLVALSGSSTSF